MATATLAVTGQLVVPAEIRARYELSPGTQVEFADEGGIIRLVIGRRSARWDPESGYGMFRVAQVSAGAAPRRLSEFEAASLVA